MTDPRVELPKPRTADELKAHRAAMVAHENRLGVAPDVFTCDECQFAIRCRFAFDGYNTNGDCLASK